VIAVFVAYGLTESGPGSHVETRTRPRTGSCGELLPGVEARVSSTEGRETLQPWQFWKICSSVLYVVMFVFAGINAPIQGISVP